MSGKESWGVDLYFEDNGRKYKLNTARKMHVFDRVEETVDKAILEAMMIIGKDVKRHIRSFVEKGNVQPGLSDFTTFGRIGSNPEWETGQMVKAMEVKILSKLMVAIGIPINAPKTRGLRMGKTSRISLGVQAIYQSKGYSFTVTPKQAKYMRLAEEEGLIPPGSGHMRVGSIITVPPRNFMDQATKSYVPKSAPVIAAAAVIERELAKSLRKGMRRST